ncbi:MAG: restriction endonuclease [Fuerstiella sp.]
MTADSEQPSVASLKVRMKTLSRQRRNFRAEVDVFDAKCRRERLRAAALSVKRSARRLVERMDLGRAFWVVVAPPAISAAFFILIDVLTGSRSTAIVLGIGCLVASAIVTYRMLNIGDDSDIEAQLWRSQNALQELKKQKAEARDVVASSLYQVEWELSACKAELRVAKQHARNTVTPKSGGFRLNRLYQRNWRAMRDVQFENFLEEVLRAQGYVVETTAVTGDQGVDLVVAKNGVRVAIQVKGYLNAVGNAAVQQAFAGMAHYGCQTCAVITNSRFTSSAVELANSTDCLLIHEENFRDFVLGKIPLVTRTSA